MIGFTLGISAGYLAALEADSGNRQAAEASVADGPRLTEMAVREMAQGSFGRVLLFRNSSVFYGFPGSGIGFGGYALPLATGDYETLRNLARAIDSAIEQLKAAETRSVSSTRNRLLETAFRTAAESVVPLEDYPAADAEIKRALEIRKAIPKRNLFDERDAERRAHARSDDCLHGWAGIRAQPSSSRCSNSIASSTRAARTTGPQPACPVRARALCVSACRAGADELPAHRKRRRSWTAAPAMRRLASISALAQLDRRGTKRRGVRCRAKPCDSIRSHLRARRALGACDAFSRAIGIIRRMPTPILGRAGACAAGAGNAPMRCWMKRKRRRVRLPA